MSNDETAESAEIPNDGHFFNDGNEATAYMYLPDYQPYGLSSSCPLTLTDCHLAMKTTIRKARLTGFEIARRNRPFFKRTSREITLQGDPRELDIILSSISDRFDDALTIKSIHSLRCTRLMDVLKTPLVAHKDFKDSSTKLKRSLFRTEKNFGQNIIEPLKKAMINKSAPDFPNLIGQATHYQQGIMTACKVWREKAKEVCTKVKATEGWHEATELDDKIEILLSRARATGWNSYKDKKFVELHFEEVFQRADGPSPVVTYLEGVLNRPSRLASDEFLFKRFDKG